MPDIPVVILGSGSVGKSCITIQYIHNHFVEAYDSTIEDLYRKQIDLDGIVSTLSIVDTAGQEAHAALRDPYLKSGQGFVLVYSITDSDSFQQLKRIYAQLRRTKGDGTQISCIVVGNKLDLGAHRCVSVEEGQMFARTASSTFVEISAKDGRAVEDMFAALVRAIRNDRNPIKEASASPMMSPTSASPLASPEQSMSASMQSPKAAERSVQSPMAAPPPKPPKKKRPPCTMV